MHPISLIPLIDLTSLKSVETEQEIHQLCRRAHTPFGPVAAVCVWPRWVSLCAHLLRESPVAVATVVNFPHGRSANKAVLAESIQALDNGARELDLVVPWHQIKQGCLEPAATLITEISDYCRATNAKLKVILETGELNAPALILQAANMAIESGADFIKTSTGKAHINATTKAAIPMLQAIAASGKAVGFKAAGGIQRLEQAHAYVRLALHILGPKAMTPERLRFGASGLLNNILRAEDRT